MCVCGFYEGVSRLKTCTPLNERFFKDDGPTMRSSVSDTRGLLRCLFVHVVNPTNVYCVNKARET